jgi:hypothetical protein
MQRMRPADRAVAPRSATDLVFGSLPEGHRLVEFLPNPAAPHRSGQRTDGPVQEVAEPPLLCVRRCSAPIGSQTAALLQRGLSAPCASSSEGS